MSLDISKLRNEFLRRHLDYVEHTESPQAFHVWSAISCVSACMGRHLWIDNGLGELYGNLFVLLVGPPATKKSTAIKLAARLMRQSADVRIAPDDTGGQRQGLLASFLEDDEDAEEQATFDAALDADNVDAIAEARVSLRRQEDRFTLFALASEFGSFIGQNNLDFTRCLIKLWDGDPYDYKLTNRRLFLDTPLLACLGGTTPDDMATLLPAAAMGQGFTSRIILVYEPSKGKVVPPSEVSLKQEHEGWLNGVYRNVWYNMFGEMQLDPAAEKMLDQIYVQDHRIEDTRFVYYAERRDSHLRKLSMCLAAARGSTRITVDDVYDGELMLRAAERRMPDALGEYGLSPLSVARQKLLEYLRHAGEPVSERVLWAMMQKDMKLIDFQNTLGALCSSDKITPLDIPIDGQSRRMYMFNDLKEEVSKLDDEVLDALLSNSDAEDYVH